MDEASWIVKWITVGNVSLIALIVGPVLAVVVARRLEDRRAKRERCMHIFRTLMATRRNRLSFDHVSSLNLVEIEFQDNRKVIQKWKDYFTDLCSVLPRRPDEEIIGDPSDEGNKLREERYRNRVLENRADLLTKLLYEMAKVLDYKIEAFEILKGGYSPEGWGRIEDQQELIRQYCVDLYFGRKALPVLVYNHNDEEKTK